MQAGLAPIEARSAARHPVSYPVIAEHPRLNELALVIANISATGFMATGAQSLTKGDRLAIRLPVIGRIEAHLMWTSQDRSGFQFERLIRADDFAELVTAMRSCQDLSDMDS